MSGDSQRAGRPTGLHGRLSVELAAKLRLFAGLTVGICVPYFTLQRVALGTPFTPPATLLDAAIPFAPAWVWAYASLYALVPLSALLSATRSEVAAFARGLVWLCAPSFLFFALFPSVGPRPPEAHSAVELGWLIAIDTPGNAFPSLHAGLTVFCLLHARRVCRPSLVPPLRAFWDPASLAWGAAIAFGALANKQHWVVDLVAGGALGALAHWLAARHQRLAAA